MKKLKTLEQENKCLKKELTLLKDKKLIKDLMKGIQQIQEGNIIVR